MSYVFWPARTENYFPPGPPYLAPLRGLRGLGDYDADLKAYKTAQLAYSRDMVTWNALKKKYDADVAAYATTVSSIDASAASEQAAYQRDLASWNKEYAMYLLALNTWNADVTKIKQQNAIRAATRAQAYGITIPQWFVDQGFCLSQAQIDAYAKQCVTVKGLGHAGYLRGLGSNDPDCGWKGMPLCSFPARPAVRAKPIAPRAPSYPAKPTLRAQPVSPGPAPTPPAATTPVTSGGGGGSSLPSPGVPSPSSVPIPDSATDPNANSGMVRNGLLLVALGVGGYLVYRTLRKPKAAA